MSAADRNYGHIKGLAARVADWVHRVKFDKSLPWAGLGILADMEAVLRLLSLEEFAAWLRTHPDDELQRWAGEVRDAIDAMAELDALPSAADLEDNDRAATQYDEVRKVLVDCGALAPDDKTTNVPDLLRALLA